MNIKFVEMDSTNLLYNNESFDTVVDTFGLQSCYDYESQYSEMKRVYLKILLLFTDFSHFCLSCLTSSTLLSFYGF